MQQAEISAKCNWRRPERQNHPINCIRWDNVAEWTAGQACGYEGTRCQEGMVSLNVGESSGVKQGFTGYVVEKDEKTGVYRYLAEFVIINVFPEAATAVVMPGPEPDSLSNILANIRV